MTHIHEYDSYSSGTEASPPTQHQQLNRNELIQPTKIDLKFRKNEKIPKMEKNCQMAQKDQNLRKNRSTENKTEEMHQNSET